MANRIDLPKLLEELRICAAELASMAPILVALARHLESAAQHGDIGVSLTLGEAVERIVDRLRDH